MHKHLALAALLALATVPAHAQSYCTQTLPEGFACIGPAGTEQIQPSILPGQYSVTGRTAQGQGYGCTIQQTITGDVVSTCP